MPRVDLPPGPILVCPCCASACRVGSPYYLKHLGKCDRCDREMEADADLARVRKRNALYKVKD